MRAMLGFIVLTSVVGCGSPYDQVQAVLSRSCASPQFESCHQGGTGPAAGLDLSPGHSYAAIVGRPSSEVTSMDLITPGDPANSYLFRKLDGTFQNIPYCMMHVTTGECGARMPMVGGVPLADGDLEVIRAWIADGAHGP